MAGGTHIFDMIKRLKENENLRKKSYFKNKGGIAQGTKSNTFTDNTATEEEREVIRSQTRAEEIRERKKSLITLLLSVFITIGLIVLLLVFLKY